MSSQIPGAAILLANYGMSANRTAAVLPATGNQTLFTVTGGRVLILGLIGEVTTVMSATATNLKLTTVTTVGAISADIAANTAVTSVAAGNLFSLSTLGGAMTTGPAVVQGNEFYVQAGIIRATTDATNTGAMRWQALWIPVDRGAALVVS